MPQITTRNYRVPLLLVTSLFFLWGFARNILTVLNKHFQDALHITIAQSAWVEISTFVAYFLMAIPAGILVRRWGFKRGMIAGLALFAIGALLFIPCTMWGTFQSLLLALFVLACGLAFLEVAANPYVTLLGPKVTSSSRLNLAQSFNGLGAIMAPWLAGKWLLETHSDGLSKELCIPYGVMGLLVALMAVVFCCVKLPDQEIFEAKTVKENVQTKRMSWLLFAMGFVALLAYEVAEIGINSYFINYMTGEWHMPPTEASSLLSGGLLFFLIGRLLGSWFMCRWKSSWVLLICAAVSFCSMAIVLVSSDQDICTFAVMCNFLFESIMFPSIYSLSLSVLPASNVKLGGSILMMSPIGGCSFFVMGRVADATSFSLPFVIPLVAYGIILLYALHIGNKSKYLE